MTTRTTDPAVADGPPASTSAGSLSRLLRPVRTRLVLAVSLQVAGAIAGIVPFIAVVELARVLLPTEVGDVDSARAWGVAWVAVAALLTRIVLLFTASTLTHLAAVGHTFIDVATAVTVPLVSLGYLVWVDWRFALLSLVPVIGGLGAYASAMSASQDAYRAYDESAARLATTSVEFAQGIAVVKSFGQAGRARRRFSDAAEDYAASFRTSVRQLAPALSVMEVLLSPVLVMLWVLGCGTAMVVAGAMAAIDVLPFMLLLALGLGAPLLVLGYSAQNLRAATQAASRIVGLLALQPLPQPRVPVPAQGIHVRLAGVGYSYDAGRSTALEDVTFDLAPGSVTAVVGPSGAGKSTLARLVVRFDDVDRGSISIGGVDLRELGDEQLYRLVSFVFQDVGLLRTSIRDNIALARPEATDDEVEAAARAAHLHDVVAALPRGYRSVVGQDASLSGGEAQRVSIARALLADAPVLVLDEATAHADAESEAAIQDALSTLVAGRTLLVVAHRLSTITGADQILVMAGGRVVERGRHEELLARRGTYWRSWYAYEPGAELSATAAQDREAVR